MRQAKCYGDAADHWIDVAVRGREPYLNTNGHYGDRMWSSGASIYSYGTHFEMARVLYEGKGKKRTPRMILVNGERASNTTTNHQGHVRDAVRKALLPSVIIPFGALEAASIDLGSIEVLGSEPDRTIYTEMETDAPPRRYEYVSGDTYEPAEWSSDQVRRWNDWHDAAQWEYKIDDVLRKARWSAEGKGSWGDPDELRGQAEAMRLTGSPDYGKPNGYGKGKIWRSPPPTRLIATGERVSGWHATRWGWSIDGATDDGIKRAGIRSGVTLLHPDPDGKWRWTRERHILGESIIKADVNTHRMIVCEACEGRRWSDMQPNLRSVEGSIDWRYVSRDDEHPIASTIRQVPVPWVGPEWERRRQWTQLIEPVWGALPLPMECYPCQACNGRGRVRKPIKRRGVKFLSGFDHGEPHLAYFFCELPKCDATTVDEAYEALKPDAVKLAEQMGRPVKRQGDIFAIETTYTTAELKKRAKRYGKRNPPKHRIVTKRDGWRQPTLFGGHGRPIVEKERVELDDEEIRQMRLASMLLGTNHQGTEVIHADDGTIYARGCLWHVPDGRTNDHVRVKLGKAWHIILKNAVPVRRTR